MRLSAKVYACEDLLATWCNFDELSIGSFDEAIREMSTFETWSILLSVAAIIVSLLAIVVSVVTQRRQDKGEESLRRLQEQLTVYQIEAYERAEAELVRSVVRVFLRPRGRNYQFVLRNEGRTKVTNVNLEITPQAGQMTPLVPGDADRKLPIKVLQPGDECTLLAGLSNDSYPPFEAKLTWEDSLGKNHTAKSTIYN